MPKTAQSCIPAILLALSLGACAEDAKPESCDAYAEKIRTELLADDKLGLDSPEGKSLLDYAVDSGRKGCLEEMTQPEVECSLAGKSGCFDEHRPWYRKLKYKIEDLTD